MFNIWQLNKEKNMKSNQFSIERNVFVNVLADDFFFPSQQDLLIFFLFKESIWTFKLDSLILLHLFRILHLPTWELFRDL